MQTNNDREASCSRLDLQQAVLASALTGAVAGALVVSTFTIGQARAAEDFGSQLSLIPLGVAFAAPIGAAVGTVLGVPVSLVLQRLRIERFAIPIGAVLAALFLVVAFRTLAIDTATSSDLRPDSIRFAIVGAIAGGLGGAVLRRGSNN